MSSELITHIQLPRSKSHRNVIVCGSPERAEWFSKFLENAKPIAKNREYHSYLGKFQSKDILITSHGIGAAGAAICFQELIDAGAEKIIRIGTAGALQKSLAIGSIVLASGAVRMDGLTRLMIPPEFPAVPDFQITKILSQQLPESVMGMVLTSDLFYPGPLSTDFEFYSKAHVLAVEMECSSLFVISSLRKIRAAALLVIDGNALNHSAATYDPRPETLASSLEKCFQTALNCFT